MNGHLVEIHYKQKLCEERLSSMKTDSYKKSLCFFFFFYGVQLKKYFLQLKVDTVGFFQISNKKTFLTELLSFVDNSIYSLINPSNDLDKIRYAECESCKFKNLY